MRIFRRTKTQTVSSQDDVAQRPIRRCSIEYEDPVLTGTQRPTKRFSLRALRRQSQESQSSTYSKTRTYRDLFPIRPARRRSQDYEEVVTKAPKRNSFSAVSPTFQRPTFSAPSCGNVSPLASQQLGQPLKSCLKKTPTSSMRSALKSFCPPADRGPPPPSLLDSPMAPGRSSSSMSLPMRPVRRDSSCVNEATGSTPVQRSVSCDSTTMPTRPTRRGSYEEKRDPPVSPIPRTDISSGSPNRRGTMCTEDTDCQSSYTMMDNMSNHDVDAFFVGIVQPDSPLSISEHGSDCDDSIRDVILKKRRTGSVNTNLCFNSDATASERPRRISFCKEKKVESSIEDYGYGDATPDVASKHLNEYGFVSAIPALPFQTHNDELGYEDATPDVALKHQNELGYEDAAPDVASKHQNEYGYEDATPDVASKQSNEYGYEDATPDVASKQSNEYGYEDATPDVANKASPHNDLNEGALALPRRKPRRASALQPATLEEYNVEDSAPKTCYPPRRSSMSGGSSTGAQKSQRRGSCCSGGSAVYVAPVLCSQNEEASTNEDLGYEDACPDIASKNCTGDYGYGDASPDIAAKNSTDDYGYGDAAPDIASKKSTDVYGYGDAAPDIALNKGESEGAHEYHAPVTRRSSLSYGMPEQDGQCPSLRRFYVPNHTAVPRRSSMKQAGVPSRRVSLGFTSTIAVQVVLPGQKKVTRRSSITFSNETCVQEIAPLTDQKEELWFQRDEYKRIKNKIHKILENIRWDDTKSMKYCLRGLEGIVGSSAYTREEIDAAVDAVLDEQDLQFSEGVYYKDELIAAVYATKAELAKHIAQQRAEKDSVEVEKYVADTAAKFKINRRMSC